MMTREEFKLVAKQAIEFGRSTVPVKLAYDQLIAHDAEQRQVIEELQSKIKAYEGGALHDDLVAQAQKIDQQAQTIQQLREALIRAHEALRRGQPQILGALVVQDFNRAIMEAQRVLEETK